jgi:uncharacterized membrane protein
VTAKPSVAVQEAASQEDFLCVYVPTTPNPTSGYMVFVRKDECKPLNLSVDEALTYVVSMGVVDPATSTKRNRTQPSLPLESRV